MAGFMPFGYRGFHSYQFAPSNQTAYPSLLDRYGHQRSYFSPPYPAQPIYHPSFYPNYGQNNHYHNMNNPSSFANKYLSFYNQADHRYQQAQYMSHLDSLRARRRFEKLSAAPMNPLTTTLYTRNPSVYQFEREVRYVPYPVYVKHRNYPNMGGPAPVSMHGSRTGFTLAANLFQPVENRNLAPKIRVIFIPSGSSSFLQPSTGPLTMPPFLYNRMAQPLCSFPLPPPLPQVGSLPLAPSIQQMVMQRYENPVAVLPFSSNWQMPQTFMPNYSQSLMYQPMAPASSCQPIAQLPESIYSSNIPIVQPRLPMPQAFTCGPLPVTTLPPISNPIPSYPVNSAPSASIHPSNGYPAICRACPPPPPSLNVPINGHCWVQHCSACHHIPNSIPNANMRPAMGRSTPLLRHPIVPQYVPEQARPSHSYHRTEPPVMMRPWLRKTPPLPPGAVVISDQYLSTLDAKPPMHLPRSVNRTYSNSNNYRVRASTSTSTITAAKDKTTVKNNLMKSVINTTQSNIPHSMKHRIVRSKSLSSNVSSRSSSSHKSSNAENQTKESLNPKAAIPEQLMAEARNININYNYQPQELPSVYLKNRYVKSSSEASTPSVILSVSSSPTDSVQFEICTPSIVDMKPSNLFIEKDRTEENTTSSPPSMQKSQSKRIIVREITQRSPSAISITSTIASDIAFSVLDKDSDTASTVSTIKGDLSEDEHDEGRKTPTNQTK